MNEMFLDDKELRGLTRRVRNDAQVKVLNCMGIIHRVRPDGSIVVLRDHVQKEFAGQASSKLPIEIFEPNWGAING